MDIQYVNVIIAKNKSNEIVLGTVMSEDMKKIIDAYNEITSKCISYACTCSVTTECPHCFAVKKILEIDKEVLQNGRKGTDG